MTGPIAAGAMEFCALQCERDARHPQRRGPLRQALPMSVRSPDTTRQWTVHCRSDSRTAERGRPVLWTPPNRARASLITSTARSGPPPSGRGERDFGLAEGLSGGFSSALKPISWAMRWVLVF